MKKPTSGGGWQAVRYSVKKAGEVGPLRLWQAMHSKNACKTCALGMGGQQGGMRNEAGHFPEVCKKSMQAMVADMRGKIEPRFFEEYSVEQLRGLSPRELEALGRLCGPIVLDPGATHFRSATWDEALAVTVGALRECRPERSFFYCSGRSSNEAGFLLQLFARAYGTNHVSNCSFYCHQASGVGLKESIGQSTATVALDDVEEADLLFLIGGNPSSNHPRFMATLARIRENGGHVVVVNPVREVGLESFKIPSNLVSMLKGSPIASHYVQVKIGGDIAFLAGLAKATLALGAKDDGFITASTIGFHEFDHMVKSLSWSEIEAASGVTRHEIEEVARVYAGSERTVFAWTMGITHHVHGVENVQWIVNLALLRGMVGKPGAGLLPIRGHSNVQGLGTVGVTPAMTATALAALERLGVVPPSHEGRDTLAALEAAARGDSDFGLCLGGNLYGASPDATFVGGALGRVRTLVYMTTTLNTGHVHGLGERTVVLPVLARDEEPQSTTQESMFSYVRLSDGGRSRFHGPRSETDVLASIGSAVLGGGGTVDWEALRDHNDVRKLVAEFVPELGPIADIGVSRQEFTVQGRIRHVSRFATDDGRARFITSPIPRRPPLGERELALMTVRSEGQFNTVVYEETDIYRGQERRDVVLMHPDDMEALGLVPDQPVDVSSATGQVGPVLARPFDIARRCALMYFPEANVLVPKDADGRSKTPAFKNVFVTVSPSGRDAKRLDADKQDGVPVERGKMKAC
ncbi:MAG: FdhF/YdeP family oxidoreductase [Armatimonadetes bacterium]|nr:FdhF/YdeP family oxidoreductase [Armatimonadota bacterium]